MCRRREEEEGGREAVWLPGLLAGTACTLWVLSLDHLQCGPFPSLAIPSFSRLFTCRGAILYRHSTGALNRLFLAQHRRQTLPRTLDMADKVLVRACELTQTPITLARLRCNARAYLHGHTCLIPPCKLCPASFSYGHTRQALLSPPARANKAV